MINNIFVKLIAESSLYGCLRGLNISRLSSKFCQSIWWL